MSETCCSTSSEGEQCEVPEAVTARRCPGCGGEGPSVERLTVAAMTRPAVAPQQNLWLCRSRDCDVVYHGDQGARFRVGDLHVVPGFKTDGPEGLVCYCYLHTRGEIENEIETTGTTTVPDRITVQIKAGNCQCEVRNPAGRCCLGEVNREVKAARERLGVMSS